MTHLLTVDPGLNTGIALGYYDATTPYQLLDRWQVHRGVHGFIEWKFRVGMDLGVDELLYERFIPDPTIDFAAAVDGVPIEGVIEEWGFRHGIPVIQHTRVEKGELVGYQGETDKIARQRIRFDFLASHGLFVAGTEHDDSNDAVTHAVVSLRKRRHIPTMRRFWPPRRRLQAA